MTLPTDDKSRKGQWPLWDFMFGYFPDAWLELVRVSVAGNDQHNPGEKLHWARGKSTDQLNTAFRHQFDYGRGTVRDIDGQYHLAKAIWRLMAQLQLDIEGERSPKAVQAKLFSDEILCRYKDYVASQDRGVAPPAEEKKLVTADDLLRLYEEYKRDEEAQNRAFDEYAHWLANVRPQEVA